MAFLVEDGTGLPLANSYCDVDFADAFATDRNKDSWMRQSPTLKAKFLVQAADYIDRNFRYLGVRSNNDQALEFPRRGIPLPQSSTSYYYETLDGYYYPSDAVPENVKKAACEYAFRAAELTEQGLDLQPDPAENLTGTIVDKTEQVGTLMERTKWSGATPSGTPGYPAADRWLKNFRTSGNPIERA